MNLNKLLIENYRKSLLNELQQVAPADRDTRYDKHRIPAPITPTPITPNQPISLPPDDYPPSGSGEDVGGEGDNVAYPNPNYPNGPFPGQVPGGWGPGGNPNAPGNRKPILQVVQPSGPDPTPEEMGTYEHPGPKAPDQIWYWNDTVKQWVLRVRKDETWGYTDKSAQHPPDGAWYWNSETGRFERYRAHWWHWFW